VRRLTKTPWFGPKRYVGWGWRVATWQGWVVTAIFAALALVGLAVFTGVARWAAVIVVLVGYFVVILLTGTPPGGPRATNSNGRGSP
jgi:hypothetical protein